MCNPQACGKILVVEDDIDIRSCLQEFLELEGFDVSTAANGREALQVLDSLSQPCLILLDLMMPEMNGWQFLDAKSHHHVLASIPVVVASAVADRIGDQPNSRVVGQIHKPIDLDRLLAIVNAYCRDRTESNPDSRAAA